MRFIYILGILLLIAIGFLVYFYKDWLWGTIDGFQGATGGNVVFQLFEQRCYNTSKYFPTVSKLNAVLMCEKLGGKLATYSELKTAVIDGLVIDSDKPAMVVDSDVTYESKNGDLIPKSIDSASPFFYKYFVHRYYDLYGYVNEDRNWETLNIFELMSLPQTQKPTETYGHPVCFAPAPPDNTVDVVFPTRAGKGWNNDNDTITGTSTFIGGTSFTKRYNIRKRGDTTPFNVTCPMPARRAAGSTITLKEDFTTISFNTPVATQTSYNILDLDTVYSQLDIAKIDLPKHRDTDIRNEIINIPDNTEQKIVQTAVNSDLRSFSTADLEQKRRIRLGYATIKKEMRDSANSKAFSNFVNEYAYIMSFYIQYWNPLGAFLSSNTNNQMTVSQYSNILIKNIHEYYNALLLEFQLHPIAFLRKNTVSFPAFLNTFKIYNLPDPNSINIYMFGSFQTSRQKEWEIKSGEANHFGMVCQDGTSDYYYNQGSIGNWDFRTESQTNYDHNPPTWWCRKTQGLHWETSSCRDGTAYSWWAATCLKEYYQARTAITDLHYMISSPNRQRNYTYNNILNQSWRPNKDPDNPININVAPSRTINVIGTISDTNIKEIEDSISYAICFNFTDTSRIESQIRISSEDKKLYMSYDASAKPEYENKIDVSTKTSRLESKDPFYNAFHCGIEINSTIFSLLPFHTRNLINQWAVSRLQRVELEKTSGSTSLFVNNGSSARPSWNEQPTTSGTGIFNSITTPIKGTLFGTNIMNEMRNSFLDSIARFYYERENTNMGSDGSSNSLGYAIIHKFLDIFQIGNTIFDVRFEEYRKRGLQFQRKLGELESYYTSYKQMNLSKRDQLLLEERYLKQKLDLYKKDDNYIWGKSQDCGVEARYIVINSTSSLFNISQVVVISSAGQNVALGSSVLNNSQISVVSGSGSASPVSSPDNLDYGSISDDPRTRVYYNKLTGDQLSTQPDTSQLTQSLTYSKNTAIQNEKIAKELLLTDGKIIPRHSSICYKTIGVVPIINVNGQVEIIGGGSTLINGVSFLTRNGSSYLESINGYYLDNSTGERKTFTSIRTRAATYVPLIIDLGNVYKISVVEIIVPSDVIPTNTLYQVELKKNTPIGGNIGGVPQGISNNIAVDTTLKKIIFRYGQIGDDNTTCPNFIYERFKVARFYTDYDSALSKWTVRGYTVGINAALTFDPKYNAGIFIDTTVNGGTFIYKPNLGAGSNPGYNLNIQGSPENLNCLDPNIIKKIFNQYNILVNSETFRYNTRIKTSIIQNPEQTYTAVLVKSGITAGDTCRYIWLDKVVTNTEKQTLLFPTVTPLYEERYGEFPYAYNTEDFTSTERIIDLSGVGIRDVTDEIRNSLTNLSTGSSDGIIIPEMYTSSISLDTANGFCPGLPCSDTRVMNSLLNIYNSNLSEFSDGSLQPISKIYKAITPNPFQCEFLVDTVGNNTKKKVLFNLTVAMPNIVSLRDSNGNIQKNDTCLWVPLPSITMNGQKTPGVIWNFSPDIIETVPFLTRTYNYALDIIRPFTKNITNIVNDLVGLGSMQMDPAGSGIVNALVKYRKETAAAAGDIRYFQNWSDEFGNQCVPPTISTSPNPSANYPRCRSTSVLESLYKYYSEHEQIGSHFSKIASMIRTGMTDDGMCDFTFETINYSIRLGGTGQSLLDNIRSTTGLRCNMQRIPFSCDFEVTNCTYINPEPPLSDIQTIPSEFVQSVWLGSGSDPKGATTGSDPPAITSAGINTSGSQILQQPQNGNIFLRSIDYVDCASDYGGKSTNTNLTSCANDNTFIKAADSLMYVKTGWSPGNLPAQITLLSSAPSLDVVRSLVPYTIISAAGSLTSPANMFEYRITTSDKLDFGRTYIRAGFYTDSVLGSTQLAYLVPATPINSPNAFFAENRNIASLTNQFITYWNKAFTDNKNIGNKIGTITGYYISRANDSIIFRATSATFGELGSDDIQYYYPNTYYVVYFRNPYNTGSGGSTPIIYKMNPTPNTFGKTEGFTTEPNGSMIFTDVSVSISSSDNYIVQNPIQITLNQNKFRSFKFTVKAVTQDSLSNGPRIMAEIARINFWSVNSSGGSGTSAVSSFVPADVKNATVQLDGTYADYISRTGVCATGYETSNYPGNDSLKRCIAMNDQSYPAVSDGRGSYVACGIGYYGPIEYTNTATNQKIMKCKPTGYFQDVISAPIVNTNMYVPRLRLNVDQTLTIDLNSIQRLDAFSFILGSSYNHPLQWTLQGSINNNDWVYLYNQSSNFSYASTKKSFFNPGFFMFSPSTGSMPTSQLGSAPLSVSQLAMQGQMLEETKEGFLNPDASKKRVRHIRWKIMETQRPDAAYVHASVLQFHTKAGPIPIDSVKISNPLGTRRKPIDGPASLLSDSNERRWVDYNKSDLLIMFDLTKLPANSIYGFQFRVPANLEKSVDFLPARWLLEGSYDGRTWMPLHNRADRARIIGGASPIYKFSQQI
jgi:hypothetical protein